MIVRSQAHPVCVVIVNRLYDTFMTVCISHTAQALHHAQMQIERGTATAYAVISAIRIGLPGQLVVTQGIGEGFGNDPLFQAAVQHRYTQLHATEEVAVHPVSRRNKDLFLTTIVEIENTRVLQKASDD